MSRIEFLILAVCLAASVAELVGPDRGYRNEKSEANDEDEEIEMLDSSVHVDSEYLEDIKKVVNEQLEELKEIMANRNMKGVEGIDIKERKERIEESAKILNKIDQLTQKFASQIQPEWLDTIVEIPGNNLEFLHENPQDLLDKLPPPPVEEEDLTPEQKEAKDLFEDAVGKLLRRTPDLRGAILQVKEAADMGHIPAKIKLAWSYLYGEGVELDFDKARMVFEELSEAGYADAHVGMGFMFASGIGKPVSQAKALVHYTIAALGDSIVAKMALAYRYWSGHTVPASCPQAMQLYMNVAAQVASEVTITGSGAIQRVRLLDEAEGGGGLDSDLIDYYQLLAEKGDVQAQVGLGQLHLQGGRGVTLDINKALHYFTQAANAGNAVANAFLGKIYLEGGDGIKSDNETALRYFKKAAELNNAVGQSGLGLMYLQGRGVPKDTTAAFKYFTMAANQGWVEGQLNLGFMYFGGIGVRRDFKQANKYFSLAAQSGHVLALYHLAQMHAQGLGVMRSCTTATELFKNVCERGPWGSRLMLAAAAWRARDTDSAFVQYMSVAEMGYEVAQSNAAYLLDNNEVTMFGDDERWTRALQLWGRSAAQSYSAARVKLGDYHYYGLGTKRDLEAAAHHYRIASEQHHNPQATFNLGYMHERGLGLARDPHLAKRCYDLAADSSPDARLPAAMAAARLHAVLALDQLKDSPLAMVFLGDSIGFLSNWDLYLITAILGMLGLVVYLRRPQELPAN